MVIATGPPLNQQICTRKKVRHQQTQQDPQTKLIHSWDKTLKHKLNRTEYALQ